MSETQPPTNSSNDYDADKIQVLEGLEAVRKPARHVHRRHRRRAGLHHLVYEVVDNCDRRGAGRATARNRVRINADNGVIVIDDGRGIPVDIHKDRELRASRSS